MGFAGFRIEMFGCSGFFCCRYDGCQSPVIMGSALKALQGDPEGEKSIHKLVEAMDTHIPEPTRDFSSPFLLPIEQCFTVPHRGTVAIGTLVRGTIKKGAPAEILGHGAKLSTVLSDVQVRMVRVCSLFQHKPGHVGCQITGVSNFASENFGSR